MEKPTLDEVMQSMMEDTVQKHKATPQINEEVVAMLVSLYEQNEKTLKNQDKLIEVITDLANKEPVKITTQEVKFPAVMEVEEVSPIKEFSINNLPDLKLPNFKAYFDALSTENVKGQFAIIEAVDRLTEFLQSIDW